MFPLVRVVLRTLCSGVRSRRDLMLENLALRQQLMVLQRATPYCPKTRACTFSSRLTVI